MVEGALSGGSHGGAALKAVVHALSRSARPSPLSPRVADDAHAVPFRASLLTRMVQDALGGGESSSSAAGPPGRGAACVMLACLRSDKKDLNHSLQTVQLALRARRVLSRPTVHEGVVRKRRRGGAPPPSPMSVGSGGSGPSIHSPPTETHSLARHEPLPAAQSPAAQLPPGRGNAACVSRDTGSGTSSGRRRRRARSASPANR